MSILTEPGTNHDASLFLRATSLSCRTIFTGRNRRFPCCIRPDQNTPGQTKAPFSPRNAEKRVQVNVFTWPCRNRHSPVRSPQALSSEKLRSAVRSEVLDGTNHLRGVGVLVVVPRHDLDLVGVVVATPVFRVLFVVVHNFETTVTVPQRTVVVLNTACSYHYYTTFHRYFQVFLISFSGGIFMRAMSPRAFGLSTTAPTSFILFSASNTELHARLLLFSRRSIQSSFVYCPFRPYSPVPSGMNNQILLITPTLTLCFAKNLCLYFVSVKMVFRLVLCLTPGRQQHSFFQTGH